MTKKYKKNFLKTVLFRIDYSTVLSIEVNKPVDFQSKVMELGFQKLTPIQGLFFELTPSRLESQNALTKIQSWQFSDASETKKITLQSNSLTYEVTSYESFDKFRNELKTIIGAFFEQYKTVISRIGLRYINIIDDDDPSKELFDWKNLINTKLLHGQDFYADKNKLSRILHVLNIKESEYLVQFQYGHINTQFPNTINSRQFVLDYDCFIENINLSDKDILLKNVETFHVAIENLFESSITPGLRDKMGELKDEPTE